MGRKISILNFKGGVGKTSLSVNLAHALVRRGARVLLIDCDMQANSSSLLEDIQPPTLTHVLRGQADLVRAVRQARPNLFLLPSDQNLHKAANHIVGEGRQAYYALRKAIGKLNGYDFILFDHSPNYNAVTESALLASEEMLIPCELAPYSVEGLLKMFNKLEETLVDHALDMTGIVPFKLNRSINMHLAYLDDLRESFGERVLPPVRTDTAVGKAQSYHLSVFEYDEREKEHSKAAEDFNTLAVVLLGEE
jgi:chromosome partitioning protein